MDRSFTSDCFPPHLTAAQLQTGERIPEEDSHLSDQTRLQAHKMLDIPSGFRHKSIFGVERSEEGNTPSKAMGLLRLAGNDKKKYHSIYLL
jgi:hypothetical protein